MTTAATGADSRHAGHTVSAAQIAAAVEVLAGPWTALRQRHKRHEGYRALVGALLSAALVTETVEALVVALSEVTDDEEAAKRLPLIADTAARLREGQPVQGGPALVDLLGACGDDVVARLGELLGVKIKRIVATYDYEDETGVLRSQTVRYDPKDFKQRRPDRRGGWIWDLKGVPRLLYRLPELVKADPSQIVFLPEGEKDVDNLRRLGLTATTNPMGAEKWRREFNEALRGRRVVILPDNDEPGAAHARDVARNLAAVAAEVKILELPGLPPGGDVSDWLAAGGTVEELHRLAAKAPVWQDTDNSAVPAVPAGPHLPSEPPWPDPLPEEAFHGLAGDIVRTIEPASEADPAALLFQTLIGFGNLACRNAHFIAEADKHFLNEFVVLIGKTAKGRKGASWGQVRRPLEAAEEEWARERVQSGLSSGEGLIWAVRDPITHRQPIKEKGRVTGYEEVEADPGVA